MKYLKKFNENNISDIQLVADTLLTEIFDEYDIYEYKWIDGAGSPTTGKFWSIIPKDNEIVIGNLGDDYTNVLNDLHIVRPIIRKRTGIEYDIDFYTTRSKHLLIIKILEKVEENLDHLKERGIDPNRTYFIYDKKSNDTFFFLYNLSGDCIGFQKYNQSNPKEGGLGWDGKYFTKVHKEATGHSKIAVYGLETYNLNKNYFFVAEGIFDIIKVHNTGEPGIANLGCSVSRQAKNWYNSLPQIKIVIQDRDDAGTELGTIGDYVFTVPEPYKDLGDMPQEEVNYFIKNIKKEIGI